MITQLYEQAAEKRMEYRPFSFPLELNSEKTKLVFTHKSVKTELDLSPDGFTYLAYRIGEFINRGKAKALYRAGDYEKFVEYVNQCRKQQEDKDLWRKGKELIIAFNGGKLWGVLTHYNPKSNLEVLRDISDAALEQQRYELALAFADAAYRVSLKSDGKEYRKTIHDLREHPSLAVLSGLEAQALLAIGNPVLGLVSPAKGQDISLRFVDIQSCLKA